MNKFPVLARALFIGFVTEAVLCGVGIFSILCGGFGPCGPSGDFPGWLVLIHLPGFFIAQTLLPYSGLADVPIMLLFTAALLSAAAYGAILVLRRFKKTDEASDQEVPTEGF